MKDLLLLLLPIKKKSCERFHLSPFLQSIKFHTFEKSSTSKIERKRENGERGGGGEK
jgi:hypothetical protein